MLRILPLEIIVSPRELGDNVGKLFLSIIMRKMRLTCMRDWILIEVLIYESIRESVMRECIDSDVIEACAHHINAGVIKFRLWVRHDTYVIGGDVTRKVTIYLYNPKEVYLARKHFMNERPDRRIERVEFLHYCVVNTTVVGVSPRRRDRDSGSTCAVVEMERQNGKPIDEVRLGVAVIQQQLMYFSADEVVLFICRYLVVMLLCLFRLDLGKDCVSCE
ncbi:hypothetical protein HAX54_013996, partial [Datura stramonium]|nr:hypothetical protein [Datura stramonium]